LEKVWPVLRSSDADGIILRDTEQLGEVLNYGLPAVVIGHQHTEVSGLVNVVTDSEAIGRMGAEHLLACGFKNFAYCGYAQSPREQTPWSEIRGRFFSDHVLEAGFGCPSQFLLSMVPKDWSKERRSLAGWLKSLPKPLGLMACNDDCSRQVMEACKLAELSVPDAVGVIGADNDEIICGLTNPPMSSVAVNFERAGYDAAHALDGMMRRSSSVPSRIMAVASHVVARRSTDFVASDEPYLARALKFIRDRARESISVDDVARSAGLSRRALEKRFRYYLGRSVLDEVRRVRTDQIARLLVETDMTISEISDLLEFADAQHIARYFRAGKQMSPGDYRKAYGQRASFDRSQNGDTIPQTGVVSLPPRKYSKYRDPVFHRT
jgi:LacI family transcriptional regulator